MGKITAELLGKIAPGTKPDSVRDRFLPFLNEACPRYGITTELRVAAFLATICFESNYFRATKEGRARSGSKVRAVQDKYWGTGFYGRGLIQTTHRKNYVLFSQAMFKAGVIESEFLFVEQPELLEQPKWAVESACYFWQSNHLNTYADKGKFFAIQGLTNRGDAGKEAWGYDDRLKLYEAALRYMPDDFSLVSTADSPKVTAEPDEQAVVGTPTLTDDGTPGSPEQPSINQGTVQQTTFQTDAGDSGASQTVTQSTNVAVGKEVQVGFLTKIKLKLAGWFAYAGGLAGINEYKHQLDDLGLPGWIIMYVIIGSLVAFVLWLVYEAAAHLLEWWGKRKRTDVLAQANSTPTNTVTIVPESELDKYAKAGWVVIRRGESDPPATA